MGLTIKWDKRVSELPQDIGDVLKTDQYKNYSI